MADAITFFFIKPKPSFHPDKDFYKAAIIPAARPDFTPGIWKFVCEKSGKRHIVTEMKRNQVL